MIYPYLSQCGHRFEVIKSLSEIDREEPCPSCGKPAERQIGLCRIDKEAAGGWNQQQWAPALGQWVKSTKEARQLARSRGMEEVGSEPVENLHKMAEKTQAERREQRWREADREKVYSD
jgi:putative FmdB family regulatory protein